MGLHRFKPIPSGRMGILWTLATIKKTAVIEFGCMGHMMYSGVTLKRSGVYGGSTFYSTHINEADISLGCTDRIDKVVQNVIEKDQPDALFLLPSAVPEVIGTDLGAVATALQRRYKDTPILALTGGGFDKTQNAGIQSALTDLVRCMTKGGEKSKNPTFNLIGSCADLLHFQADAAEICRLMKGMFNMDPICVFPSDASVENLANMGQAHVNLVIRQEGKSAAMELKKRFGTPFVFGRPYGVEGTVTWLKSISEVLGYSGCLSFLQTEKLEAYGRMASATPQLKRLVRTHPHKGVLSLGGHTDVVMGIQNFACRELGLIKGDIWCDAPDIQTEEVPFYSEEKWSTVVSNHKAGWLMASGEALEWGHKDLTLQIANPDTQWRISPYTPPLVGFRGAVHLTNLWINTADDAH